MTKHEIEDTAHFDQQDLDFLEDEKLEIEKQIVYSGREKGAFVVFITGPDKGNAIAISKEKVVIGRDGSSDIVISKKYASKKHAKIVTADNKAEIIDYGSTNGTYLNNAPIKRAELKDSDEIRIGDVIIKYFRIDLNDEHQAQASLPEQSLTYTDFYKQAFDELKPYFGQMTARFLNRQITAHVGKSPYTIAASDKKILAKWVKVSAGLLLDDETAVKLAERILLLK